MATMSPLGEAYQRSISLGTSATDYAKYVKVQLAASRIARAGYRNDALALATPRDASSQLQAMIKASPNDIDVFKKQITRPRHSDDCKELLNQIVQKSAVAVGGIDTGTWGSALAQFAESSAGFVQSLSPFSSFDRILSDGGFRRAPLRSRVVIASSAAIASVVDEGLPKPVSTMAFTSENLRPRKAVAQVVVSDELTLSMLPGSTSQIQADLGKAVGLATDAEFLRIISESTGIVSNPSTGLGTTQFLNDLETALQAVEVDGPTPKLYLIVPMSVAKTIALLRDSTGPSTSFTLPQMTVTGGTIQGIRVVVTSAATNDGILLDASSVAADGGVAITEVSNQSTIELEDNPTAGSHQLVSLWQNNLQLTRTERFFGAVVVRSDGIAVISDMATT
jgi:Phage capsid family